MRTALPSGGEISRPQLTGGRLCKLLAKQRLHLRRQIGLYESGCLRCQWTVVVDSSAV